MAENGEMLARLGLTDARVVLAEGHIQTPVQTVLNSPVGADRAGKAGQVNSVRSEPA